MHHSAPHQPHVVRKAPRLSLMMRVLVHLTQLCLVLGVMVLPYLVATPVWADGALLFSQTCAGCHVNGGNIIRRGKTLKLAALERQGLDSSEAIAGVIAAGIGQMSGYGPQLGEAGVEELADWVWQQAQQGWPRSA